MAYNYQFSTTWDGYGRADVGGFGIGSKFTWQAALGARYHFCWGGQHIFLVLSYRALSQDYKDGDDRLELFQHGPILGLGIKF